MPVRETVIPERMPGAPLRDPQGGPEAAVPPLMSEEEEARAEICLEVMEWLEAYQLRRYLSRELVDQIWNEAAVHFHFPA